MITLGSLALGLWLLVESSSEGFPATALHLLAGLVTVALPTVLATLAQQTRCLVPRAQPTAYPDAATAPGPGAAPLMAAPPRPQPPHAPAAPSPRDTRPAAGDTRRATGRGVELVLLVAAAVITTAALVSVEVDQADALRPALGYLGSGVSGGVRRGAPGGAALGARRRPVDPSRGRAADRDRAGDDPPPRSGRRGERRGSTSEPAPSADALRQLAWAAGSWRCWWW